VVIDQIDVESVAALKAKNYTPIGPDRHAPKTFQITLEGMEPETRKIHVLRNAGSVQDSQNVLQLFDVIRTNTLCFVVHKKLLEPFVPKTLNHRVIITQTLDKW
jgi:hypothetical protein